MAATSSRRGFTIVELLVVVTIIVVLLAMLAPAMSRAIYQAQLAACAATLKSMGPAVTGYAMENRNFYPDRTMASRGYRDTGGLTFNPHTVRQVTENYDMRPRHRKLFPLNRTMQCPLSPQIDLDPLDPAEDAEEIRASYVMFWAWQYKEQDTTYQGMFKVGDRFEWKDDFAPAGQRRVSRYSVLAGDLDLAWGAGGGARTSHPDREPAYMAPVTFNSVFITGRLAYGQWASTAQPNTNRGLLDTNFMFADLSVARYNGVTAVSLLADDPRRDRRMGRAPINFNHYNNRGENVDKLHIPVQ